MARAAASTILLLAWPTVAPSSTLHVPDDWPTIQAAVDAAVAGDSVVVAPGIYTDRVTRTWLGGLITASVLLKDGVTLVGSGGPDVTTIDFGSGPHLGAGVVIIAGPIPQGVTVHGFTLKSGRQTNGGVYLYSGEGRVENCRFVDLEAIVRGAGVLGIEATTILRDCTFENCMATYGGAVAVTAGPIDGERCSFVSCSGAVWGAVYVSAPDSYQDVRFAECRFHENVGGEAGGGLWVSMSGPGSGEAVIEGCWFEGNVAPQGSACYVYTNHMPCTVRNNVFVRNVDQFNYGVANIASLQMECTGNTFVDNVGGCMAFGPTNGTYSHNLIVGTRFVSGASPKMSLRAPINSGCHVVWDNDFLPFFLSDTDVEADPEFCDPELDDYNVRPTSPCLAENSHEGCGVIGNREVGCGTISVEPQSWARTKSLYREAPD